MIKTINPLLCKLIYILVIFKIILYKYLVNKLQKLIYKYDKINKDYKLVLICSYYIRLGCLEFKSKLIERKFIGSPICKCQFWSVDV